MKDGVSEDDFVDMREARDATLAAPELLMPSIQVNMRAGKLPPADENGVRYLRSREARRVDRSIDAGIKKGHTVSAGLPSLLQSCLLN